MKVLFFKWNTNIENRITEAFNHLDGFYVSEFIQPIIKDYKFDSVLMKDLIFSIHKEKYDCIFSVNFFPFLSEVANITHIRYYSWLQDSPCLTLYYDCVNYDCNVIYSFDSSECQRLRMRTNANIHYLPLASDYAYWANKIQNSKYTAEEVICFLGSSYKDTYYDTANELTDYEQGYYEALINIGKQIYGPAIIENSISTSKAMTLLSKCHIDIPRDSIMTSKELGSYVLEQKLSAMQRQQLLLAIAEKYPVHVYSKTNDWHHPNIIFKGYADYENQMPIIFNKSAINLNLTLRSIHSGIPLRVLDVLACKGFLISNYQSDIAESFNNDEIVLFDSENDLLEKTDYYMKHTEERRRISQNGYEKVSKYFTYEHQLNIIFSRY